MKTITFTDFRKYTARFIAEVERGETLVLMRRGTPVAEVVPYGSQMRDIPSWKYPGICLQVSGAELSTAILEEREIKR